MEKYCVPNFGSFCFSRPLYVDQAAKPAFVEFGVTSRTSGCTRRAIADRSLSFIAVYAASAHFLLLLTLRSAPHLRPFPQGSWQPMHGPCTLFLRRELDVMPPRNGAVAAPQDCGRTSATTPSPNNTVARLPCAGIILSEDSRFLGEGKIPRAIVWVERLRLPLAPRHIAEDP